MIVRIMGEGQVDLTDADLGLLNDFDAALEAAIEADDEAKFRTALHDLLEKVREDSKPLPPDALEPSQFILPHADASMEEVREMLQDDGLIPG
ncbi:PspA-associated protein PspAA [Nocardiopsis oceani]